MSQTPITDAELAALDAAVGRMTPGGWEVESATTIMAPLRRVAGNYDYEEGGICCEDDTRGIVAIRNSYASLRERLRAAWAERDAEREECAKACRERADMLNRLGRDHAVQNTYTNAELRAERRLEALACEAAIRARSAPSSSKGE